MLIIPAYGTRIQHYSIRHMHSHHCCFYNVLGSQNAHPSTVSYISQTLFFLRVIYNKSYCRCVVRFKLNRSPSAYRPECGQPYGLIFFLRIVPPQLSLLDIFSLNWWQTCFKLWGYIYDGVKGPAGSTQWRQSVSEWRALRITVFPFHDTTRTLK